MDNWTTRFIIRPSESLKSKTAEWESELKALLLETTLWNKTEGHRTMWKDEDRVAQIKLLFLASLKQYSNISDFEDLVGEFQLNTRVFDRWWIIEKVNDSEIVEKVERDLGASVVEQLEQTCRPLVDAWISDLREKVSKSMNNPKW